MHIKVNDTVIVMTGDQRGQRGKFLSINHKDGRVIVQGINRTYKHVKPSQRNRQGGRLSKELPIQLCSVMLVCPQTGLPTRVGIRYTADGRKERYSKRTVKINGGIPNAASMGVISPPRKAYAAKV